MTDLPKLAGSVMRTARLTRRMSGVKFAVLAALTLAAITFGIVWVATGNSLDEKLDNNATTEPVNK